LIFVQWRRPNEDKNTPLISEEDPLNERRIMKETISEFKATYSLEAESDSEFASILLQPTTIKIHALRNAHDITVQRTYQKVEVNSIILLTEGKIAQISFNAARILVKPMN